MSNILRKIASNSEPRYIALGTAVYRVERVVSDEIRRQGWATLEGASATQEALQRAQDDLLRAHDVSRGVDPATLDARSARDQEAEQDRARAVIAAMNRDAASQLAFLARCDAYVLAAVSGIGDPSEPVDGAKVYPRGTVAADVSAEVVSARFVRARSEEDVDAGRVWLHHLSEAERRNLGLLIQSVQQEDAAREVAPFRGGAGSAPGV